MNNNYKLNQIINDNILSKLKNLSNYKKVVNPHFFIEMLKKGWFFLFFSFFTNFLPICGCLIGGMIKLNALEVVMGIGLLSSFQIIFTNVCLAMAFSMIVTIANSTKLNGNKTNKFINENGIVLTQILVNFIVSIFMTMLFIGISFMYVYYNSNHPNLTPIKTEGFHYLWVTSPNIILNSYLCMLLLLFFKKKGNFAACGILLFEAVITIGTMLIFANFTKLNAIGIGIGYDIGIVSTLILLIILDIKQRVIENNLLIARIDKKEFLSLAKNTYKTSVVSSWRASTRGMVVVILSIVTTKYNNLLPLNLIFAKIFWFNTNYLLVYFGTGISNALTFYTATNKSEYNYLDINPFISFIIIIVVINTLNSGIWFGCMPYTINAYISNNEAMRMFALNHLYDPTTPNINQSFQYGYETWKDLNPPEWINDPIYSSNPTLINYIKNNGNNGLGQLYWVNVSVNGNWESGEASIMKMFWGLNIWSGNNKYSPFFSPAILLIILYHIFMMSDNLIEQISVLYTHKPKQMWISILINTIIMSTVIIFGYFEVPLMGINAYVIPFLVFSVFTFSYTLTKFIKIYKKQKFNYIIYSKYLSK